MKKIILLCFLFFSQLVSADAYVIMGHTGEFENSFITHQDENSTDSLYVLGLRGVNTDESSKYFGKIGLSIDYGFGQYAHRNFNENQSNQMFSLGIVAPFSYGIYSNIGFSVVESKVSDEWFSRKGYVLGIGKIFDNRFLMESNYNAAIKTFSFEVGYRFF